MAASRIAVDAMGGDKAPETIVQGVFQALREDDGDLFEHLFFGPFENVDDVLKWTQRASSNPHNVTYAIRSRRLRTGNRDSAEHGSSSAASPFRSTALSASRMEMRRNERR